MMSLQNTMSIQHLLLPTASTQLGANRHVLHRRGVAFFVKSEQVPAASNSECQDEPGRRQLLAMGATVAPWLFMSSQNSRSFAAETKKGFLPVVDRKDGYTFLHPFGWQEVVIEGQDKVFKDVVEPLESVSVNMIPTAKQDIRDFGSPKEVAEILIKKVLVPPSQKAKLIEASEIHSKKRNKLTHKKLQELVYVKDNQALKMRHANRDKIDPIDPISLSDIDDANEWLIGKMGGDNEDSVERELVFSDDDKLTWRDVAQATGAEELRTYTRKQVKDKEVSSSKAKGKGVTSTSSRSARTINVEEKEEEDVSDESFEDLEEEKDMGDDCDDNDGGFEQVD